MTATKAPKKKTKKVSAAPKALTFKQLVALSAKSENAPSLLKMAAQDGWLSDEVFMTRLTDKEQESAKELYRANGTAKRAAAADPTKTLPAQVGPMVEPGNIKISTRSTKLTVDDRVCEADTSLFLTMQKRHPHANVHLSVEDGLIIFSEKTTVAVIVAK
jgi:hypothetical protein